MHQVRSIKAAAPPVLIVAPLLLLLLLLLDLWLLLLLAAPLRRLRPLLLLILTLIPNFIPAGGVVKLRLVAHLHGTVVGALLVLRATQPGERNSPQFSWERQAKPHAAVQHSQQ